MNIEVLFQIIGALGLLIIIVGTLRKEKQDLLFAFAGICLLTYSIYLKDPVFIPLQIVFTLASLYSLYKN